MAGDKQLPKHMTEERQLIWRNFSGKAGPYNAEGDRSFSVILDPEEAQRLADAGWNVKFPPPKEDGEVLDPTLSVKVKYKRNDGTAVARPPKVVVITSRGKRELTEDTVGVLDFADIVSADMIIQPRKWEIRGEWIVAAYLESIYVTIREDALELKYADTPDAAIYRALDDSEE